MAVNASRQWVCVCGGGGGGEGVCGVNAEYLICHTRKLINCEVCFKFKGDIS